MKLEMQRDPVPIAAPNPEAELWKHYAPGPVRYVINGVEVTRQAFEIAREAEATPPKHRLITTADACLYTGRDRQVLYRWAREGRITRYGSKGRALWDVRELPPARPGADRHPGPPIPRG